MAGASQNLWRGSTPLDKSIQWYLTGYLPLIVDLEEVALAGHAQALCELVCALLSWLAIAALCGSQSGLKS